MHYRRIFIPQPKKWKSLRKKCAHEVDQMTLHVELPTMPPRRERRLSGTSFEAALGRRMASVRRHAHTFSRTWNWAGIFEYFPALQEAVRLLAKEEPEPVSG